MLKVWKWVARLKQNKVGKPMFCVSQSYHGQTNAFMRVPIFTGKSGNQGEMRTVFPVSEFLKF